MHFFAFLLPANVEKAFAVADTHYVNNVTGADAGTCTLVAPCLTLTYAYGQAVNGDTVSVSGAGTYVQPNNGVIQKELTWVGVDDGIIISTDNAADTYVLYLLDDNITFDNFTIQDVAGNLDDNQYLVQLGGGAYSNIHISNSDIVGGGATKRGVEIQGGSALEFATFTNTTFSGTFSNIIYHHQAGLTGGVIFDTCTFNYTAAAYIFYSDATGTGTVIFDGGTITDAAASSDYLFRVASNISLTIQNMTVTIVADDKFFGSIASATGAINISHNSITYSNTTVAGILVFLTQSGTSSHTITIHGNTFTTGATSGAGTIMRFSDQIGSIVVDDNTIDTSTTLAMPHITFYNTVADTNTATQTATPSRIQLSSNIHKSRSATGEMVSVGASDGDDRSENEFHNAIIENNKAYGPGYFGSTVTSIHGFIVGYSTKAHFRNNYANGFYYGIIFKGSGMDFDNVGGAYGNIFVNNQDSGVYTKGIINVPIHNNIFYLQSGKTVSTGMVNIGKGSLNELSTGSTVRNNIFHGYENANSNQIAIQADCSLAGSDYNIFYSADGAADDIHFNYGGTSLTSFAAWKNQAAGYDAHSLNVDPGFNAVSNLLDASYTALPNFALNATSPSINAGTTIPANTDYGGAVVHEDFFGELIPLFTNPTIGAVDYVDTTAPVSSHSVSGTIGSNGWYKTTLPTVSVSASDNVTNADPLSIYAEWADATPEDAYAGAMTATEGTRTLYYYSKDSFNNPEAPVNSIEVKADPTAPNLSVTAPTNSYSTTGSSVVVTGNATDATSGISTVTINSVSISSPASFSATVTLNLGANTLTIIATDVAGNTSTQSLTVTRTNPIVVSPIVRRAVASTQSTVTDNNDPTTFFSAIIDNNNNNGQTTLESTTNPTFYTQYPKLKGKTYANATVAIEIHSDPILAEVTSDAEGYWEYTPTKPLDFGSHTVTITVKEKSTNNILSTSSYKFNIVEKANAQSSETVAPESQTTDKKSDAWMFWLIGVILVIIFVSVGYKVSKKQK